VRPSGIIARHDEHAAPLTLEQLADLSIFGWRNLVVWLVAALAVYILVLLLRMARLSRPPPAGGSFEQLRQAKLQPYLDGQGGIGEPLIDDRRGRASAFVPDPAEGAGLAWNEAPQRFAEQQVQAALQREVEALREEVGGLREAFSALREDLLKDLAALRAQQGVAAFYREAMRLALAGRGADEIAAQCGIARAEADLVIALAQAQQAKTDDREPYG
jgi:hypothetical protein